MNGSVLDLSLIHISGAALNEVEKICADTDDMVTVTQGTVSYTHLHAEKRRDHRKRGQEISDESVRRYTP